VVCGGFRGKEDIGVGKEGILVGKEGGEVGERAWFGGAGLGASDGTIAGSNKVGREGWW
jgi:hypothetical protein